MTTTQSPGHRFTFQFNTTTTCPTRSTSIHHLPTNEQTHLPTQTTWSNPSPSKPPKRNKSSTIQRNIHKQLYNSLTDTHPPNKPSSSHNPRHTLVHTSCSQEVKHMRLRTVAFVYQLPRRLMLPHPAAANPADVVQFCPNKSAGKCHLQ